MLWSADIPLPKCVFGHGFVTAADGQKMSKSIGNVVDPVDVLAKFPSDSFRYYLLRGGSFGADVAYAEPAMALTHNADLADTLGNLVHRLANLSQRMCSGAVPPVACDVVFDLAQLRGNTELCFARMELQGACELAINAVKEINKYLTDKAPWHIKEDPIGQQVAVRSSLEGLYLAAHFLSPFLPDAMATVFERLNTPARPIWTLRGTFDLLAPGTPVTAGDILFAKVEIGGEAQAAVRAGVGWKGSSGVPWEGMPSPLILILLHALFSACSGCAFGSPASLIAVRVRPWLSQILTPCVFPTMRSLFPRRMLRSCPQARGSRGWPEPPRRRRRPPRLRQRRPRAPLRTPQSMSRDWSSAWGRYWKPRRTPGRTGSTSKKSMSAGRQARGRSSLVW